MALEILKEINIPYMSNYRSNRQNRWNSKELPITISYAESGMPANFYCNAFYKVPMFRVEVPAVYHWSAVPLPYKCDRIHGKLGEQIKVEFGADEYGSMRHNHCYDSYAKSFALFFLDGESALEAFEKIVEMHEEWATKTFEAHLEAMKVIDDEKSYIESMRKIGELQVNSLREKLAMI